MHLIQQLTIINCCVYARFFAAMLLMCRARQARYTGRRDERDATSDKGQNQWRSQEFHLEGIRFN